MKKRILMLAVLSFTALLAGCDWVLLNPSGDIAIQQRNLMLFSVALMLVIIGPVIGFTLYYAWKYRASSKHAEAEYSPDWDHSSKLEALIWGAPIAIIVVLGTVTWIATHRLDPYKPLERLDANRPIPEGIEPLVIEVVALDWKWLFLYPEQGIGVVNELVAPVDVPIEFKITSSSMMNSFFIPALAGQIYAMAGMQTKLHAVINQEGVYKGFSANYSGHGYSHMNFNFHGVSAGEFDEWVGKAREGDALGRAEYLVLEQPSEREPVRYFGSVDPALYHAILNLCVRPGAMCMDEMMHIDMAGGAGVDSRENLARLQYDNRRRIGSDETPASDFPYLEEGRPRVGDPDAPGEEPLEDSGELPPQDIPPEPEAETSSDGGHPGT